MDSKEEEVQRITARYVAETRAGRHPKLSEYIRRYPQYADAIADFVAYYHAIEEVAAEESGIRPPLSVAETPTSYQAGRQEERSAPGC
jgi:hypothetical protein